LTPTVSLRAPVDRQDRTAAPRSRLVRQEDSDVMQTWRSAKFLVTTPLLLAFLFVVNLLTSPGDWWVQWAALGLGIAWVISLLRVARAVILAGGLAALAAFVARRRS
jgi:hypothetical protein